MTQKEYFKDIKYVSRSMLKRLIDNNVLFEDWIKGKYEYPYEDVMKVGSYVHYYFLEMLSDGNISEDEKPDFNIVPDINKRTKAGRETYEEVVSKFGDNYLQQSDLDRAEKIIELLKTDRFAKEYVQILKDNFAISVEEVVTGTINGVDCKAKMDVICRDIDNVVKYVIDLKTTNSIYWFLHRNIYEYWDDVQYAMDTRLFSEKQEDIQFDFLVCSVDERLVNSYTVSTQKFIESANNKLDYALKMYKSWSGGEIFELKSRLL